MALEVFTYASGDIYATVMNGVAALTSTGDWKTALRVIFYLVILASFLEVAFTGSLKPGARVLIFVFIAYAAVFPKVDIQITDRINPAKSTSVGNVPIGLAIPIFIFSNLGNWFTQATETVFAMPSGMNFTDNGILFGSRLIKSSSGLNSVEPLFAANLAEFSANCVYYGANVGWFTWDDLVNADDLWGFLSANKFGDAIYAEYVDPTTKQRSLIGCKTFRNNLNGQWNSIIDKTESLFAVQSYPGVDKATAKTRLLSALPISYNYMLGISKTASQLVQQNIMINALNRGYQKLTTQAGASAALQDYAIAQGEIQATNTYSVIGESFKQALPMIQALAELVAYGLFPLIILSIMISRTPGKAAASYLQFYIFLQLIPPLYALFHSIMSYYAAEQNAAYSSYIDATGSIKTALTMLTYNGVYKTNQQLTAMASYMTVFIPGIALAIAKGSGGQIASSIGSLGSVLTSALTQTARSASSGNISLGATDIENSRMFQHNMAPTSNYGYGSINNGVASRTIGASGNIATNFGQFTTSTPLSGNLTQALTSGINTQSAQSVQAQKQAMVTQAMAAGKNWNNIASFMDSQGKEKESGINWSSGNASSMREEYGKTKDLAATFAKENGITESQAASLLATMSASASVGGKIPFTETGLQGKLATVFEGKTSADIKDLWKKAQQFNEKTGYAKHYNATLEAAHRAQASGEMESSQKFQKNVSESLSKQIEHRHATQAAKTEAQSWQQMQNQMSQKGQNISLDAGGALYEAYANKYGRSMAETTFNSAASGSRLSMSKIMDFVNQDVMSNKGLLADILQIDSKPTRDNADQYYAQEAAKVDAKGDSQVGNAINLNNQTPVEQQARNAGVPTQEQVNMGFDAIQKQSIDRMGSQHNQLDAGKQQVENQGEPLKQNVSNANNTMREPNALSSNVVTRGGKQIKDSVVAWGEQTGGLAGKGAEYVGEKINDMVDAVEQNNRSYFESMKGDDKRWAKYPQNEQPAKTSENQTTAKPDKNSGWEGEDKDLPPFPASDKKAK